MKSRDLNQLYICGWALPAILILGGIWLTRKGVSNKFSNVANVLKCPKWSRMSLLLPLEVLTIGICLICIGSIKKMHSFTRWPHNLFHLLQFCGRHMRLCHRKVLATSMLQAVMHNSFDVLPSGADQGSCAHKRVCYNFMNRRDKWRK